MLPPAPHGQHASADTPDPRRRFNRRERSALFRAAGGRCSNPECGAELEPGWHADHRNPHSRGGTTDVVNGQALCPPCNLKKGNRMAVEPRRWQAQFLDKYTAYTPADFLVVACPGAGKTLAAGLALRDLLDDGTVERVLVVVPSAGLREQWRKALAQLGICVDEKTVNNGNGEMVTIDGAPTQGWVVTYQSLAADPLVHRMLNAKRRTIAVLDEVHHLSAEDGAWGKAATQALETCVRRLSLSGTPFRGDQTRIPFVEYEQTPDGGQQCRYKDGADGTPYRYGFDYSYGVALTDEPPPVRPVVFEHYDGDVEWMGWDDKAPVRVRISEEIKNKMIRSRANRHVLHAAGEWLSTVLQGADSRLVMVRAEGDPKAKGLVICLDTRHADAVADRLREITGERVFTAVSKDAETGKDLSGQARTTIENFGSSDAKWLVAVQMVTEGVDIPELRVAVYATVVRSPLFFRQVVGRVVRRRKDLHEDVDQTSYLFVPKEPRMLDLAASVQDEVTLALINSSEEDDREESGERDYSGKDELTLPFDPFREATADEVGVLVPGQGHVPADRVREVSERTGYPFGAVAAILAANMQVDGPAVIAGPVPVPKPEKPRERIDRRRALLENLLRQYTAALLRTGQGQDDYGRTIARAKTTVYELAGIYSPGMTPSEKKHAYKRADLPAIDVAIGHVTKLLGET